MSGHSKWSTIKHDKAATDKIRGHIFTKLANTIMLTVREGGGVGDPGINFKLRLAIEKAHAANMPKENIERAIARANGKLAGSTHLEEFLYEGYGPGGVAILVEGVTENKYRVVSEVKNVFSIRGGTLGSTGSVVYLYKMVGEIFVQKTTDYDKILEYVLELDAQDMLENTDQFIIYTKPQNLHLTAEKLTSSNLIILNYGIIYKPVNFIQIDAITGKKISELVKALEELPDVHKVYFNTKVLS